MKTGSVPKTRQRVFFGFMDFKDGVQLRELQQIRHLATRIGNLHLTPRLAVPALALRASIPLSILVLENGRAAGSADGLRNGSQRHNELAKSAAVDIRNVAHVQKDLMMAVGNFVANGLSKLN